MNDVERFVERFKDRWTNVEPESFADLWDPEGTLLHPGMEKPIPASEVSSYIIRVKSVLPDIRLRVTSWAARGNDVLIEWVISATFASEPVEWAGVDRFTLRGDRAFEGVAYFDTLPLWARIDPSMKRGHMLSSVKDAVGVASVKTPSAA